MFADGPVKLAGGMTVCLAALCEDGRTVVVASDRMVTFGGILEFEHTVPKMTPTTSLAMVMVAGDTLLGTELAQTVATQVRGTTPSIHTVAVALGQAFQAIRRREMEVEILLPRALDLNSYYGAHASLNGQIVVGLDHSLTQFSLGVELLLGGVDEDGAHIYSISNPNQVRCHDIIGHGAVGIGAIHALQSMIGIRHDSTARLAETVFRAYASKRRSEAAPGVGRDTDLAIVSEHGIRRLTNDELQHMSSILDEHQASTTDALEAKLAALSFSEGGGPPRRDPP
jgi:20S proteasome alpha/beta subunit